VHPLLLAVGSERYTPYLKEKRPAELLTQANRILGTGQLSLAKYLFISGDDSGKLNCHEIEKFLVHIFERIDFSRDLHYYTKTSIDTLDYSGEGLNEGSKLVLAAYGDKKRDLCTELPDVLKEGRLIFPGVVMLVFPPFENYETANVEIEKFAQTCKGLKTVAQIVLLDEFSFGVDILRDYLWITYTRSNPSHDVYGVDSFYENKHWGCTGPLIFDARKKPHHAPELRMDRDVEVKASQKINP